ncbi:diguanylate cyclase [Luteimonas cucumeris]|uniref:diguanylate cyclase n=1 Tax=Luteimonas cucumeris TaxID=985012 RepID=A0A562KU68_9GAMM|nr:diguanylate cyclase [Luteimonas cucumeris]TWH98886.1 diguanylate cyclase [Luteimonas cucumeris]
MASAAPPAGHAHARSLHCPHLAYPRRLYLLRGVGLGLLLLMLAAILHHRQVPWTAWLGPLLHCLLWPHVAYRLWCRWPYRRTARHQLLLDHFLVGAWTPLIAFNLPASAIALAAILAIGTTLGGARVAWRGLACHAAGVVAGLLVYGVHVQLRPTLEYVLASLPLLLLLPAGIGHFSHHVMDQLQRRHVELERQGSHDGLSGLFNRSHWETAVRTEFSRSRRTGQPATLMLVDLDHFKQVNDLYGHAAGDQTILNFANLLRRHLRDFDVPGRYGGEEFGILLPDTTSSEALALANRLRESLHAQPVLADHMVTASFGIAELVVGIDNHSAWIRATDRLLYNAKYSGRDRIIVRGREDQAGGGATDRTTLRPAMSSREPEVLSQLLQGIDISGTPIAMFDPSDRLVLANDAYLALHCLPGGVDRYADIVHHCHRQRCGPVIDADSADEWLQRIAGVRRSQPWRAFRVDTYDGRSLRAAETCFNDGWIIASFVAVGH